MDTKICNKCKQELLVSKFHKRKTSYAHQCKECRSISRKGKYKKYKTEYYLRYKDRQRELEKLNKDKVNARKRERSKERRQMNIDYRIKINLRGRIYKAIKRNSKSESTLVLIGCSIAELKVYLSSMFVEGMSWDNYGKWHIDHIIPCASFDLNDTEQQKRCFHYTNLQPLWAIDNIKKSNKLV